jgi:hypothetical protein
MSTRNKICVSRRGETEGVMFTELARFISNRKGKLLSIESSSSNGCVPLTSSLLVQCHEGHKIKMLMANINGWCIICKMLRMLRKKDINITCQQSAYNHGQVRFEFLCSRGHRTITEERFCKVGCRSCNVLNYIQHKINCNVSELIMDTYCLNVNNNSRLRFHCNRLRHNPQCQNLDCIILAQGKKISNREYAENCVDFVQCDQDFYATTKQLKYRGINTACICACDHRWSSNGEILSLLRMFEIWYNDRFDDEIYHEGIEFTGYNRNLKIAFILINADAAVNISNAKKWCIDNGVVLIMITPAKNSRMATDMMTQLHSHGLVDNILTSIRDVRTRMHATNKRHKLFEDRCILSANCGEL